MRWSAFVFYALLAVVASSGALLAQGPPAITVAFDGKTVTASGITPGKSAVFFESGLAPYGELQRIVRYEKIATDDSRSGRIVVTLDAPVDQMTVWAVVDLTDGRYAIASPPGFFPHVAVLPSRAFRKSRGTAVDQFGFDHPCLDLLYVRPGQGAWIAHAEDGRRNDHDGANGVTLTGLADAVLVGDPHGARATEFAPGGILIAVDWYHMSVLATRVTGSMLEGAQ